MAGAVAGHSDELQQWLEEPLPPPLQMSTQLPVVVSHFRFALHETPVHTGTQPPVVESHFCPEVQLTPVQIGTQAPFDA